ncbi:Riboflavin transporter MCH5 [Cytospora mali]|uniref:Riboflavin transporter MCH5 n=1 Tax=Cytospora mali TaxID=578113 RepID=A0A194VAK1_CYTMA|nr:Riboflavin transporter MCH5 [Valsa mali var. pyri (nom. inval.)]
MAFNVEDKALPVTDPDRGKIGETIPEVSPATLAPPSPSPEPRLAPKQWLQILSTFLVFFNTWGLLLTFGVFQTYYEQVILPGQPSSNISWISTTCAFIILSAGIITGPLFDRGFYRSLVLFGSLLQVFGLMMLSLSSKYYQLFLCQAICVGLGAGIVFTPSVAAAAACLTTPAIRARAMGLMACGSSIGGIIYPIMFRYLVPQIGFPWTVRSIAFVILALYLVSYSIFIGHQQKPPIIRRFFDASALTDLPFMMLSVASLFSATAYYIPLLYLPLLTEIRIPSVSPDFSLDLLAILNGASVVGRLLAGVLAAVIGPTETISVSLVLGSMLLFCWIAVDSVSGTIAWSVFWVALRLYAHSVKQISEGCFECADDRPRHNIIRNSAKMCNVGI